MTKYASFTISAPEGYKNICVTPVFLNCNLFSHEKGKVKGNKIERKKLSNFLLF
jgi:hypothetical protein